MKPKKNTLILSSLLLSLQPLQNSKEEHNKQEIIERLKNILTHNRTEPDWFLGLKENIHIRFIEAQRLLNLSETRGDDSSIASVANYSNEIAEGIKAKLAEYAALSQSLDRTFPTRVVAQKATHHLTEESIRKRLSELEEKRFRLVAAGLLDKEENSDFQVADSLDDSTKKVLSVYVEDVEKKLGIFDEVSKRIELFQKIINQKFLYKKMALSKDKGFTFTSNGHSLAPTDLSSGEQHEIVLFYELLFKVQPNSLILIDEPELSLHVAWQVQFLKDLQAIIEIANFDVLIATHSPDIISDRWDLTVELKGPVK